MGLINIRLSLEWSDLVFGHQVCQGLRSSLEWSGLQSGLKWSGPAYVHSLDLEWAIVKCACGYRVFWPRPMHFC